MTTVNDELERMWNEVAFVYSYTMHLIIYIP
jgi:hypothetical protein